MSVECTNGPDHGEVRWLDADEQTTWRSLLLCFQLLDETLDRQLQRDSGLHHSHYAILAALSEAPHGAMRMNELASMLRFSASRMTHAITSLERKSWVARTRCVDDGRGQFATLTDQGRLVLERAAPGHIAEVRRCIFDRLTPLQQRRLLDISETILDGLDRRDPGWPERLQRRSSRQESLVARARRGRTSGGDS